jgi:Cd2+/Zn2+-exporting ATPase
VAILRREIQPLVGSPERLSFDILRGKMTVADGSPAVAAVDIVRAVGRTGMRAEPWRDVQPDAAEQGFWQRQGRTVLTVVSGACAAAGFAIHAIQSGVSVAFSEPGGGAIPQPPPVVAIASYVIGILAGGWYVAPRAWNAVRRLRPDMNLLMTIAVIGAAIIGQWLEAAVVTFLFALSLALESWSIGRARSKRCLRSRRPSRARCNRRTDAEVAAEAHGRRVVVVRRARPARRQCAAARAR